ncbi:hypothetical protein ScPMuIL_012343 [Solemya velum]
MAETTGVDSHTDIQAERPKIDVVYKLRDKNKRMVESWHQMFDEFEGRVEISKGDIFRGAPAADAIVSPANSFGFMDGGIDMAYSLHFGWQMQERLQKAIREDKNGELLVGDAIIIPTFENGRYDDSKDWSQYNEGQEIKYLISAPTMRVPAEVCHTVNAYLAFRAVILTVQRHNRQPGAEPIRTVLCPGLGTAVGKMPHKRSANQMPKRLNPMNKAFILRLSPDDLYDMFLSTAYSMIEYGVEKAVMTAESAESCQSKNELPELPTPPTDDPSDQVEDSAPDKDSESEVVKPDNKTETLT